MHISYRPFMERIYKDERANTNAKTPNEYK